MIESVLPLINTLFTILRLQTGPESIPRSPVVLFAVVAMWLVTVVFAIFAFDTAHADDFVFVLTAAAAGLCCYVLLLAAFGRSERLLPTLTSLIGCGTLLLAISALVFVSLKPFVGADDALLVAYPFTLWSVPVEGHIIARVLDKPFIVGFVFALGVFMLQILLQQYIDPVAVEAS